MTAQAVQNPLPTFTGLDGLPLSGGSVYFGVANADPRTSPVSVYYDPAMTIAASQPLRTNTGYLYRNGAPTGVYVGQEFSLMVLDASNRQVLYVPSVVGFSLNSLSFIQSGTGAVPRGAQDKDRDFINVKDYGALCNGIANDTVAVNNALAAAKLLGVGEVQFSGVLCASQIVLPRYVVLRGDGVGSAELKQLAGTNADFIVSENFAALTGTGATVSGSALVPSHFGLADCRVNGNKAGNSSGRGIAWYGPAQIMRGTVLVYGCAGDGIYTEDSSSSGNIGWQDEEEGRFGNVITRDNGGNGWLARGPHNSTAQSITCGFNGGWGFKNEDGANYSGSFDQIGSLHTYASGRAVTPAADTGSSLGSICRIGALISDGDNVDIDADRVQVQTYRCFNMGGQRDGLVVNGNDCYVGSVNGNVWSSSVGRTAMKIVGTGNRIGAARLSANNPDNNAIQITGAHSQVDGIYLNGFSTAGRIGVDLQASKCRVRGEVTNTAIAFNYGAGQLNNSVELEISTDAVGQVAVAGTAPGITDRFNMRSSGVVAGATTTSVQTGTFAIDTTTAATISVAHGLLYTPAKQNVCLSLLQSSPDSSAFDMSFMRVNSTDATNVVIGYKVTTAAPAGTLARIAVTARI